MSGLDHRSLIERGYQGDGEAIETFIRSVMAGAYRGDLAHAESKAAAKRELHSQFTELLTIGAEAGHLGCMRLLADFMRIGARIPAEKRGQPPEVVFNAQYGKAVEWYKRLLARDDLNPSERAQVHAYCGGLIERLVEFGESDGRDYSEAIEHYEASIALGQQTSDIARSLYGKLLVKLGRPAEAVDHLEASYETIGSACGVLWTLYAGGYGAEHARPDQVERVAQAFYRGNA